MRFLDVGILLCVALKQPKEHFDGCKALLERLKTTADTRAEEMVATTFLTPAVFYFLLDNRERRSKKRITAAMKGLRSLNMKILTLKNGNLMEEAAVVAEKYDVDFDDAVNALVMRGAGIKEIYALDKDYDRLEWLERIVPMA
jgi:predicted nucleic acid-binding protein